MSKKAAIQAVATAVTMTSLELVDVINNTRKPGDPELRHDNFMAKVPKVLGEDAPKFLGAQNYGNNNTRAIYILPKREACLMAMSYSYELQAAVYDRMTALEAELAAQAAAEAERIASRQRARLECPAMTDALKTQRESEGKQTASHHYSNEMNLVNRVVLGMDAKKYRAAHGIPDDHELRDHLDPIQIAAIETLQRVNTDLIDMGLPYEVRKGLLVQKHRNAAKRLLSLGD